MANATLSQQQQHGRQRSPLPAPSPAWPPLVRGARGPDVASYQGNVDWVRVARSGCSFGFTKATEGTNYINPTLAGNWIGMRLAGLVRGTYHFARPDLNSPEAEVSFFLSSLRGAGGWNANDMLALDIEDGSGDLHDWVLRWLQACEAQAGMKALVYTGAWFAYPHNTYGLDIAQASAGCWLAAYTQTQPLNLPGWSYNMFWQFSDRSFIDGVTGPCDQSYYLWD